MAPMKNEQPISVKTMTVKQAEEILRGRIFRGSPYKVFEIQQAVKVIRRYDSDHPLLRYNERRPLQFQTDE